MTYSVSWIYIYFYVPKSPVCIFSLFFLSLRVAEVNLAQLAQHVAFLCLLRKSNYCSRMFSLLHHLFCAPQ